MSNSSKRENNFHLIKVSDYESNKNRFTDHIYTNFK